MRSSRRGSGSPFPVTVSVQRETQDQVQPPHSEEGQLRPGGTRPCGARLSLGTKADLQSRGESRALGLKGLWIP